MIVFSRADLAIVATDADKDKCDEQACIETYNYLFSRYNFPMDVLA